MMLVTQDTDVTKIDDTFKEFSNRDDVAIILINQVKRTGSSRRATEDVYFSSDAMMHTSIIIISSSSSFTNNNTNLLTHLIAHCQ